ncbi:Nif11-like leader peptide family natural product precursor [Paraburkholderia sp. XV]|uniref:Nif11-like leader peptide family natural product precursor n=1 Tax=Paraburkholderia sp. XV TaxID=2831520 RepID=UPI001CD3A9FE|nr:Nif11-like leader peptide family natural product precursor [Paraburkholderia sp. XV]
MKVPKETSSSSRRTQISSSPPGSAGNSKLFNIEADRGELPPKARISEVAQTPEARLAILRDLGYTFSDFDLWNDWLILEDS